VIDDDDDRNLDRVLALAVWTVAALCVAGAWLTFTFLGWSGLWLLLAFVALYLIVFGWNLWYDRYSREGDSWIEILGHNLPWLGWVWR
jgi:hypothetical protein